MSFTSESHKNDLSGARSPRGSPLQRRSLDDRPPAAGGDSNTLEGRFFDGKIGTLDGSMSQEFHMKSCAFLFASLVFVVFLCFSSVFVFVLFGKILAESTRQQSEVQKWKLATLERNHLNHLSLRIIWTTSMSFHKLLGKAQHRFGQLCSWGFPEFVFWSNGHGIWRLKRNSWVAISFFRASHVWCYSNVYLYLHMPSRLMREKDYKCSCVFLILHIS